METKTLKPRMLPPEVEVAPKKVLKTGLNNIYTYIK